MIDTTEMYLRTIFELEEEGVTPLRARIAERLGHAGPTVSQTVARMERDGLLVVAGDRHMELTEHGRAAATRVMRKHRLAERLLVDVLGLELEHVHEEACRWEHVMSERVERQILRLIGDSAESPYGNPIPGLAELGVTDAPTRVPVYGLLTRAPREGAPAVTVVVRRIGEPAQNDPEALALITAAGARPGEQVQVTTEGDRVVLVGADGSGVSLPTDVASHVFVSDL
nr:metal-dependent transcriptional regulator [Arsenicicoccus piscis]